ncbi:hypothetical protein NQ315_000475 [Exocentrus adspersus]|uniref:GH16 domain-containing protein n=1 Tax=Exocentrus adspersus TaxID=1586481 RepID=A0AAV8VF47_9CUCU|nr:hypothetical protein NQ315_000475 [Exocentrus adspersus]
MPRYNFYSGWPASGEIDIMESRGNKELISSIGINIGQQLISSTLNWGPNKDYNRYEYTSFHKTNENGFNSNFHNYQLEWSPEEIIFYVDGEEIGKVSPSDGGFWELGELNRTGLNNPWTGCSKMAPFDQEFYIIINLAVGGIKWFPDDATNAGGKPWNNKSPRAMSDFWEGLEQWLPTWKLETDDTHLQIDHVRVWAF